MYFWTPLKETPFTLVVTYPESYGVNRIQPRTEDEIHRLLAQGHNLTDFFNGNHWSIHPDWIYCKSKHHTYGSPENELKDVLKNMSKPGWKWPTNRTPPPPEHAVSFKSCKFSRFIKLSLILFRERKTIKFVKGWQKRFFTMLFNEFLN